MGNTIWNWGVAAQELAGEAESGDLYVVKPFSDGILLAVMDGLGHGATAAAAARAAAATLEAFACESVISLVKRCHETLKGTRGAAMSLASFNTLDGTMTWLGVGNVEGTLWYADAGAGPAYKSLLLCAGIVGCRLPQLHVTVIPLMPGDRLIMTTDGISYNFTKQSILDDPPQQIADAILGRYSSGKDDALVLVTCYRGGDYER